MRSFTMSRGAALRLAAGLIIALMLASAAGAQILTGQDKAPRWPGVTVQDADGWYYEDVILAWSQDGRELVVTRRDGAQKRFRPVDILMVRDRDGRNISAAVAASRPVPRAGQEPPATGPDEEVPGIITWDDPGEGRGPTFSELVEKPLFGFGVAVGAGRGEPAGDWLYRADGGLVLNAGFRARTGPRRHVHVVFRHLELGESYYGIYDYGGIITVDASLQEYIVMWGGHGRVVSRRSARSTGFFEAGAGVAAHRRSASGYSGTEYAPVLAVEGGVWLFVDHNLAIELGASIVYRPGWLDSEELGGAVFGIHAGLMLTN